MDPRRYRLIKTIATGGMAQVYEAVLIGQNGFERRVALKRVLPEHHHDPSMQRMFFDEARIASLLHHGNIVQVLDYGTVDESKFIAMEYVDGADLFRAAKHAAAIGETIPEGVALHVTSEVAHALHYAHSHTSADGESLGIVHRDVSPHNVLLSWTGDVKLSDFGIAIAVGREERTSTGIIKGKINFMAPEQALGKKISGAADVYSLGITLLHALFGTSPSARGHAEPETMDELLAELPPGIAKLIRSCVTGPPEDRPSAREVAREAGSLASELLDRDARGALCDWLQPMRNALTRRSALDDLVGLELLPAPTDPRRFTVSRSRSEEAAPAPPSKKNGRRRMAWLAIVPLSLGAVFAVVHAGTAPSSDERPPAAHEQPNDDLPSRRASPDVTQSPPPPTLAIVDNVNSDTRNDTPRTAKTVPARPRAARRVDRAQKSAPAPNPNNQASGWLRLGGRTLAGNRVEIDGNEAGWAPLEIALSAGSHRIVVRRANTGEMLLERRLVVGGQHTRSSPARLIQ